MTSTSSGRISLSSTLAIEYNEPIAIGFKYGSASFAEGKEFPEVDGRLVCRYRQEPVESGLPDGADTVYFYGVRGNPGEDSVFLVRPLPRGKAVINISGLGGDAPTVSFNRVYELWSNLRCTEVLRPVKHLESVVEASLLKRGFVPVHAGCILQGRYAHLLLAPPDTGKSKSVMELMGAGFEYGGEDMVFLGGKEVHPAPFTATVAKRDVPPWYTRAAGLAWRAYGEKYTVYEEMNMPYSPPRPSYELGNIYVLSRASLPRCRAVRDRGSLVRSILMLNRMELRYHQDKLLMSLLTINDHLPTLDDLMGEERRGLEGMLRDASEVFVVEGNSNEFHRLIKETLVGGRDAVGV